MIPLFLPYNPKLQGQRKLRYLPLQLQHCNDMHLDIRHCTPVKRGYEIYILDKKCILHFHESAVRLAHVGISEHFQNPEGAMICA